MTEMVVLLELASRANMIQFLGSTVYGDRPGNRKILKNRFESTVVCLNVDEYILSEAYPLNSDVAGDFDGPACAFSLIAPPAE